MIDNVTGKATRVDFWPSQLDMIMRTGRDRGLLMGWVMAQLVEAARRLWPEFEPVIEDKRPMVGYPRPPRRVETAQDSPFMPRWRRWLTNTHDEDDDDGGL